MVAVANTQQNLVSETPGEYAYISTATTTDVKSSAGVLVSVIMNDANSGTITIYDDTTGGTTTPIGVIGPASASRPATPLYYNIRMNNGIQVVTSSADDVTVVFK